VEKHVEDDEDDAIEPKIKGTNKVQEEVHAEKVLDKQK
jgi:hypothetical protein